MSIPLIVAVLYYWMIFFLWMNMICCTLKHLWSSVFPRKTIQVEKKTNPHSLLFASCLRPPDIQCYSLLLRTLPAPWFSLTMDFTNVAQRLEHDVHTDLLYLSWWPLLFPSCVWTMHAIVLVGLFQPLSPQSVIVCSPNRISSLISSQMWLINLIVTLNWTITALLHQWCPWCPAL